MSNARHAPLTAEQSALAGHPDLIKLALRLAKARSRKHPTLADEFESAALVGLVDAAATFDPGHHVPFRLHASRRIAGALIDCQRDWMPAGFKRKDRDRMPRVGSIDSGRFIDGRGIPATLSLTLADDSEPVGAGAEYHDEIEGMARRLPRAHGKVIRTLYGRADRAKMKATGQAMGLCESRISQLHREAVSMLEEDSMRRNGTAGFGISALTLADMPTVTLGPLEDAGAEMITPPPRCPKCLTPYGKRIRCYKCSPGTRQPARATAGTNPPNAMDAAPAPVAARVIATTPARPESIFPAPPVPATRTAAAGLVREVEAMRRIAEAMEGLDGDACRRVLAYVAAHHGGT